jgi:hypothetical protein
MRDARVAKRRKGVKETLALSLGKGNVWFVRSRKMGHDATDPRLQGADCIETVTQLINKQPGTPHACIQLQVKPYRMLGYTFHQLAKMLG